MPFFTDQLKRTIELTNTPKRIVSVVPSQTELLYDLGLDEEVTGITKFCVHPEKWFRTKQRIGGTKTLNIEKIKSLQPDLIIANKEENLQEQIEELAKDFRIWVSDVNTLNDAYEMIVEVGKLVGRIKESQKLSAKIKTEFAQLQTSNLSAGVLTKADPKLRTCYLIWKDPYMTVGGDTFIHTMLAEAGFTNIYQHTTRYPQITMEDLQTANCGLLLLSSEPFPFKEKHIDELQQQLPQTKITLADGEMFSWYGSRLLHAPAYFKRLQLQLACIV